jgi:hypothetical protein
MKLFDIASFLAHYIEYEDSVMLFSLVASSFTFSFFLSFLEMYFILNFSSNILLSSLIPAVIVRRDTVIQEKD